VNQDGWGGLVVLCDSGVEGGVIVETERRRRKEEEGGREGGMDCVGSVLETKLDGFGLAIGFWEVGESWEGERKIEKRKRRVERAVFLSSPRAFSFLRSQK